MGRCDIIISLMCMSFCVGETQTQGHHTNSTQAMNLFTALITEAATLCRYMSKAFSQQPVKHIVGLMLKATTGTKPLKQ